jgi:hypothetical protein
MAVLHLNTTFQLDWVFNPGYLFSVGPYPRRLVETILTRRKSLEEVLGLTLSQLCHILHAFKLPLANATLETARGPNFRISDLNVESLRVIGGLAIRWTPYLEDHLRLDLKNRTLYVLWQGTEVGISRVSPFSHFEGMHVSQTLTC